MRAEGLFSCVSEQVSVLCMCVCVSNKPSTSSGGSLYLKEQIKNTTESYV